MKILVLYKSNSKVGFIDVGLFFGDLFVNEHSILLLLLVEYYKQFSLIVVQFKHV